MIIDMHYHLDERIEPVERLLETMSRHEISYVALIPTLNDPFPWGWLEQKSAALLRPMLTGWLHGLGLRLYRTAVTEKGGFSLGGKIYPIYDLPDNEKVASTFQAHPDKFFGWVFINPHVVDPLPELEVRSGQPGWIGVKSHPFMHRYPVSLLDDAAAFCVEKEWPLLVHLGGDRTRGDYRFLPQRHPRLKVIYAHGGVPFFEEVWEYAWQKKNIFVDLSSAYLNLKLVTRAVKALGANRCMFGTDGPYGYTDQGRTIREIRGLPVGPGEVECILGRNFVELVHPA